MKDPTVMQDTPFTEKGHIVDLFDSNLKLWEDIRKAIERVNANASV